MDPTARQRAVPGALNSSTLPKIPASQPLRCRMRCPLFTNGVRGGDEVSRVDAGTGRTFDGRIGAERRRSNQWC